MPAQALRSLFEGQHFRGVADCLAEHHFEASRCCVIHFDNLVTTTAGVWMNPAVRVVYQAAVSRSALYLSFPSSGPSGTFSGPLPDQNAGLGARM